MKLLAVIIGFAACCTAVPSYPQAGVYNTFSPLTRMVGGQNAERHQFPYQVSLLRGSTHVCGGILVSDNWIVTAGHCKTGPVEEYKAVLGLLKRNEQHEDVQIIQVAFFEVHTNYSGGISAYDIAVVVLAEHAKLTPAVQPVPLASGAECSLMEDAILSGWGTTHPTSAVLPTHLQWAVLPRITNEQCAEDLTYILGNKGKLDDTMLCTGANPGKSQSACSGDGGGPLVLASTGHVIGIVSWGIQPCGLYRAPTVYTNVCAHQSFYRMFSNT